MNDTTTTKMNLDARLLAGEEDDEGEADVENQQLDINNNTNTPTTTTQQRRRQEQGQEQEQQQPEGLRPSDCQRLRALTRRQWFFQLYFALAGIPLPESIAPFYLYVIQWFGLAGHGILVYAFNILLMESNAERAELDDKDSRMGPTQLAQAQTGNVLSILVQVVPMAFLFYLTRSRDADNCFRMLERVHIKWWMVAVPWIAPLGLAVMASAIYGTSLPFFLNVICESPLSLALMLCLAYAVDFGAPSVESLEALKPKVSAFQATNEPKISAMNMGFIGPMVLVKTYQAINYAWVLASVAGGNELDDEFSKDQLILRDALFIFFNIATVFCLLAPAVYHTATMTKFVQEMSGRYSDAKGPGAPCPGSLAWLKDEPIGWAVLGVKITPALLAKMGTTVFTAAYLFYSRAIS